MNFLDFMLNTYEASEEEKDTGETNGEQLNNDTAKRGRPKNQRVRYRKEANKPKACRVVRSRGHETLPRFIGKWFHRNDREEDMAMHHASMLMLLKPWMRMNDIKDEGCSFEETYDRMIASAPPRITNFISNAQYYYECSDSAKEDKKNWKILLESQTVHTEGGGPEPTSLPSEANLELVPPTEDDIEFARAVKQGTNERLFGIAAVGEAFNYGIFDYDDREEEFDKGIARLATDEELEKIEAWEKQLEEAGCPRKESENDISTTSNTNVEPTTTTRTSDPAQTRTTEPVVTGNVPDGATDRNNLKTLRPKLVMLNKEQKRAHDIVEATLKQHLVGKKQTIIRNNNQLTLRD